jgi:UDP-2,3-diacylglucosamine pyrophosphatase LpxH
MIRHLAISDLHICKERDGCPWSTVDQDLLLDFFRWADDQTQHTIPVKVIINGDAFEGLYDPDLQAMWSLPVVQQMAGMIRAGKMFLVRGNHDERVARNHSFAGLYATQGLDLLLDDVRYTHGHKWDWRCLPDEPLDNLGAWFVRLWRQISGKQPDLGPLRAIVSSEKLTNAFDEKARKWAAKEKAFLVCGHTHSPRVDCGPEWVYCNTGSWQAGRCDVLSIDIMPLDKQPTPVHPVLTDARQLMVRT